MEQSEEFMGYINYFTMHQDKNTQYTNLEFFNIYTCTELCPLYTFIYFRV